jgi:hypothetical protein
MTSIRKRVDAGFGQDPAPARNPHPHRRLSRQVFANNFANNKGGVLMQSRLTISVLVVASLFAATSIASAQTQPAPGASSESNTTSDAAKSNRTPGTTTGSATKAQTNKGVLPNPTVQSEKDSGTGRGK